MARWQKGETPNLTIGVRFHHVGLSTSCVNDRDGSVPLTNDELVHVKVDGTHESGERPLFGHLLACGVDLEDFAVFTTRVKLAVRETHGRDEASCVVFHGTCTGASIITTPDVDLGVSTSSEALSLVIKGNAGERSLLRVAEDTLSLGATSLTCVPEVDVLNTSRCESLRVGLGIPADIVNLVGITLLLEYSVSRLVEAVHLMLVVEIYSSDHSCIIYGYGGDTTSSLGNFDSVLFLSRNGVPSEDGGSSTRLTGDTSAAA